MVESKDRSLGGKPSKNKLTRRGFLKGLGALVVGAVVGGCEPPNSGREEKEEKDMRTAISAQKGGKNERRAGGMREALEEQTPQEGRYMTTDEARDLEKAINVVWQEKFPGSSEVKVIVGVMSRFKVMAEEGVPLRDLPAIQGRQIGDLPPGYETPLVKHVVSFEDDEEKESWGVFSIDNLKQDQVIRPGENGIVEFGNTKIGFANLGGMEPIIPNSS